MLGRARASALRPLAVDTATLESPSGSQTLRSAGAHQYLKVESKQASKQAALLLNWLASPLLHRRRAAFWPGARRAAGLQAFPTALGWQHHGATAILLWGIQP